MENQSIIRLRNIAKFLKKSGRFNFQNFNLSIFLKAIEEDSEISGIINNLCSKFERLKRFPKRMLGQNENITDLRKEIKSFDEWVAFCVFYLKTIAPGHGNKVIDSFIIKTGNQEDNEGLSPKLQFYNDCIEPIIIYLELQLKQRLNAVHILQRYKTLCEWYEREELFKQKETDLTQKHLSKFLFDQGFTYSLWETVVPSGRIDNLAISLGINSSELANLPEAIVVEGKIFRDNSKDIIDVENQISKRLSDLSYNDGYCVIYNKANKQINLQNNGFINGIPFFIENKKRIYFIVINLHEDCFKSKSNIEDIEISFTEK